MHFYVYGQMPALVMWTKVLNEDFALQHHLHAKKSPPYDTGLELHSSLESQHRSLLRYGKTESRSYALVQPHSQLWEVSIELYSCSRGLSNLLFSSGFKFTHTRTEKNQSHL